MKARIFVLLLFGFVISPIAEAAYFGINIFGGWTKVNNGNFVNALGAEIPSESDAVLYGIGVANWIGSGLYWYRFEIKGNASGTETINAVSDQFMFNLSLPLFELSSMCVGLGAGIGKTFVKLDGQSFQGLFWQPTISFWYPLNESYNRITALDVRIGIRDVIMDNFPEQDTELDWSGLYFSVGLSAVIYSSYECK